MFCCFLDSLVKRDPEPDLVYPAGHHFIALHVLFCQVRNLLCHHLTRFTLLRKWFGGPPTMPFIKKKIIQKNNAILHIR
jgi:hypothetical protein